MAIDKEATQRIIERTTNQNNRIIEQQLLEELEAKRRRFKVSSTDYIESSSDQSESEKQLAHKSETTKSISKQKSQTLMKGATVIPEPAYLKHKKLLEKK